MGDNGKFFSKTLKITPSKPKWKIWEIMGKMGDFMVKFLNKILIFLNQKKVWIFNFWKTLLPGYSRVKEQASESNFSTSQIKPNLKSNSQ